MKIWFYPHSYLRDRQLDTIRYWPTGDTLLNPELAERKGGQVSENQALSKKRKFSWKQFFPLINFKKRPKSVPSDAVVYCWGGILLSGKYIIDIDHPWCLTGYNHFAMKLWRYLINWILSSPRCLEIRCMSLTCMESLKQLFGPNVFSKAKLFYPKIPQQVFHVDSVADETRFLFVGTQFEIKGGEALLKAFSSVYIKNPSARLDVITYLPSHLVALASSCPGITVHAAKFSRKEIWERFMRHSDVLILPTYVDTFALVALEALAHGMGLIVSDSYALSETVEPGKNGELLVPPISVWNGCMPSKFTNVKNVKEQLEKANTKDYEIQLEHAIARFTNDKAYRLSARQHSVRIMADRFSW
jgi:glycosyltransferase involved in cell wall biosynthesis